MANLLSFCVSEKVFNGNFISRRDFPLMWQKDRSRTKVSSRTWKDLELDCPG